MARSRQKTHLFFVICDLLGVKDWLLDALLISEHHHTHPLGFQLGDAQAARVEQLLGVALVGSVG